jgi:hypothetical protein
MVLVGNKIDIPGEDKLAKFRKRFKFHITKNIPYIDMSVKDRTNIDKPLLILARAVTRDDQLGLVEAPVLQPRDHENVAEPSKAAAELNLREDNDEE